MVSSLRRRLRDRKERGAAMVEFALVAPLFFLVVFGGIEFGLMFRSHITIEDISRSAARVASIERDNPDADREILQEVAARSQGLQRPIRKVIIFSATSLDDGLPAGCIDGAGNPFTRAGVCNAYGANFAAVANGTAALETGLTPAQRSQWNNLGVYIEYEHGYITGFFADSTLSASTVEVVELDL